MTKQFISMKHLRLTIFFIGLVFSISLQAQTNHFIYLQTENKQPFYLKFANQIYSSSLSGYLIVAKLKPGVYDFTIGFPKNEWPEQLIHCAVEDRDYGYLIKHFEDNNWGFFNLQTFNIIKGEEIAKKKQPVLETKSDVFSNMLSTVVNDPTIKEIEPITAGEKKINPDKKAVASLPAEVISNSNNNIPKDSIKMIIENRNISKNEARDTGESIVSKLSQISQPAVKSAAIDPLSVIIKKKVNKTPAGTEILYVESVNGLQDTIKIFIASEKVNAQKPFIKPAGDDNNKTVNTTLDSVPKLPINKESFLAIQLPVPNQNDTFLIKDTLHAKQINSSYIINSDCKSIALTEDFLKLRKKMVAANNVDRMIIVAKKTFKSKCFTTDQIKNLCSLFLNDIDKYNFLDASYPFVQDGQNFPLLQNLLTDSYYIARFKVMIRH